MKVKGEQLGVRDERNGQEMRERERMEENAVR